MKTRFDFTLNDIFTPAGVLQTAGPLRRHGRAPSNPKAWESRETWSARIFVGHDVGGTPTWREQDVVDFVEAKRLQQVGNAGASFLTGRGLWTKEGVTVPENSTQVVIVNVPDFKATPEEFQAQVEALSEEAARHFRQDQVIVEIQKNGVVQYTYGMEP